jgi:hypothetical protein
MESHTDRGHIQGECSNVSATQPLSQKSGPKGLPKRKLNGFRTPQGTPQGRRVATWGELQSSDLLFSLVNQLTYISMS